LTFIIAGKIPSLRRVIALGLGTYKICFNLVLLTKVMN